MASRWKMIRRRIVGEKVKKEEESLSKKLKKNKNHQINILIKNINKPLNLSQDETLVQI